MALVVFLRGVNVGGHKTFRPSVLTNQLRRFDVVNVGAAGTFVVRKRVGRAALLAELRRRLPFETDVMICGGDDILRLASEDPFAGQPSTANIVRFVSVMAKRRQPAPAVPLNLPDDGQWSLRVVGCRDRFVCGVYRREMKAIRYLGQLDRIFGTPVTTRNWNTIQAIARILKTSNQRPA